MFEHETKNPKSREDSADEGGEEECCCLCFFSHELVEANPRKDYNRG